MFRAPDKLYVITAVFNPIRYRSRYNLYRDFAKRVADAGAILYTIEAGFHERDFEVTESGCTRHIQVRTSDELWIKENLWNIALARLPSAARYIATIDADFQFVRPDWADETVQQLQHYAVVQMFTNVTYLDPDGVAMRTTPGFAFVHKHLDNFFKPRHHAANELFTRKATSGYSDARMLTWAAPGGAWAYRRDALSEAGGLLDCMILGASDYYMAMSLLGRVVDSINHRNYHPEFKQAAVDWQNRAERAFRRNFGFVPGTALHYWHGKHVDRLYVPREEILVRHQFNPRVDLKKDVQGVYQLHDDGSIRFCQLRDAIRDYFRLRGEDSIDLS